MMYISKVESEEAQRGEDLFEEEQASKLTESRFFADTLDEDSRNISRQLVDLEILYLLNLGSKSGYQLKKSLYSSFRLNLSYGTLYPHLHALDRAKLICGTWKYEAENAPIRKRMYSLTQKGMAKLNHGISSLSQIALTMQFMLAHLDLNPRKKTSPEEKVELEEAIRKAEDFMVSKGYSMTRSALLRGFSGLEHSVDLYAVKAGEDGREENLILRFARDRSGVSIDDLFKLYAMSYDLQATRAIMLSASQQDEEALKLAAFYSIPIYTGNNLKEAVEKMSSDFSQDEPRTTLGSC